MKTVIVEKETKLLDTADTLINESDIDRDKALFAIKDGLVEGMIIREAHDRWILRLNGNIGCSGYHKTRAACVADAIGFGNNICIDCEVK